jgi:hypothetical protein
VDVRDDDRRFASFPSDDDDDDDVLPLPVPYAKIRIRNPAIQSKDSLKRKELE